MTHLDAVWLVFMGGFVLGGIFMAILLTVFHDDVPW